MRRTYQPRPRRLIVAASALVVLTVGCGGGGQETVAEEPPSLTVVATTSIWGDVARGVVGDDADVIVLIPIGADAHDYQLSSQEVVDINQADLVIANGLGLEAGIDDVLDAAAGDGANILEVAPLLDPLPFTDHDHDQEDDVEDHEHEHGANDPHVWMDPLRMAEAAHLIAAELETIAPGMGWRNRADTYAATLTAADETITQTLGSIPQSRRMMVTNHEAFGYFADRYNFEIIGVVIPGGSTLAEPSSAQLSNLIDTMRRHGVTVIFAETTQPTTLADAVASELGDEVSVIELYTESLDKPGSGADTLAGMLTTNATRIASALTQQPSS